MSDEDPLPTLSPVRQGTLAVRLPIVRGAWFIRGAAHPRLARCKGLRVCLDQASRLRLERSRTIGMLLFRMRAGG